VIDTQINDSLYRKAQQDIQLYQHIILALELMPEDNFELETTTIKNGRMCFKISTTYPDNLPESIGVLFFCIDSRYDVKIVEQLNYKCIDKRFFDIELKKL